MKIFIEFVVTQTRETLNTISSLQAIFLFPSKLPAACDAFPRVRFFAASSSSSIRRLLASLFRGTELGEMGFFPFDRGALDGGSRVSSLRGKKSRAACSPRR